MKRVYDVDNISIISHASCVGREEYRGPLGELFDYHDTTDCFGKKTWEQAEGELSHMVFELAMKKGGYSPKSLSFLFGGDLQNQCVASSYAQAEDGIPYFGIYGACSTCTEGLVLSSLLLRGMEDDAVGGVVTTSHNCVAERQFRTPLEYGGQRPPTAQWTTTAGGAFLLAKKREVFPYISHVMPGRIVDSGVSDPFNMGACMAPAACDTILRFLKERDLSPLAFDAIVTGDLGREGSNLLYILLGEHGVDIRPVHQDCGVLMYDTSLSDCHAGGSGCGCSASILSCYFLPCLERREMHHILFLSTGALMSPMGVQQGGSIPGIAHAVELHSPKTT